MRPIWIIAIIIGGLLASYAVLSLTGVITNYFITPQKQISQSAREKINRLVLRMESENKLKIKCKHAKAYVDPSYWYSISIFSKEVLTKSLAFYCAEKNNIDQKNARIDIFNLNTGKRLRSITYGGLKYIDPVKYI